jgi:two-component system response regulator (stage 0 sporulation protein F)
MKNILVVDDDEAIRTLLQEELTDEGYHVLTASDARQALKMVEKETLDLVILNTAYTQYQESFMSWAADAYIVKSSDLSELKAKVKELLGQ